MKLRTRGRSVMLAMAVIVTVAMGAVKSSAADGWLNACGTPPKAGSLAFLRWVDSLFDHAYASCPLERTTTIYINQGTNNGNLGTSPASPRNCNNFADLATFINANQAAGNVRFRLDQNDTWRQPASSPTSKITIAQPRITIDSYNPSDPTGPATAQAKLIGGVALGSTGWTNDLTHTNLWYKDLSTVTATYVTWTTDQPGPAPYDEYRDFRRLDTLFRRYASDEKADLADELAQMDATAEDAFVVATDEGTVGRLYVRSTVGTWNSSIHLDRFHPTEDCIVVGGTGGDTTLDNVRIDSLQFIGWGMASPASQKYAVRSDVGGNVMVGVTRCTAYFGSHHQIAHLSSGISGGGYFWVDDIKIGLNGKDGASGATNVNFYQSVAGGGQMIARNVRGTHGALKGWSTSVTAHNSATSTGTTGLIYGHTDNVVTMDLMVSVGSGWDETAVDYSGGLFVFHGNPANINLNGLASPWTDTTKYRGFIVNCQSWSNQFQCAGNSPTCYVNSHFVVSDCPVLYNNPGSAGLTSHRMVWFNSTLDVIDTLKNGNTSFYFVTNSTQTSGTSAWHRVHSFLRAVTAYRSTPVTFHNGNTYLAYDKSHDFNSGVFGVPGRTSITQTVTGPNNKPPVIGEGGGAGRIIGPNSQVSGTGAATGYDQTTSPILLSSVPSRLFNLVPISHTLRDAGATITIPDLALEYDGFGRPLSNPPSAGAVGGELGSQGGGTGGTGLINERLVR